MAKSRSYGVNDVLNWKFQKESIPQVWLDHLGNLPKRFLMYVDGDPGHGKTEYIMQLSKMLSNHAGKVHLNNVEQGKHIQITDSAIRNNFKNEIPAGKWIYSSIHDFEKYCERIKRPNSGKNQVIDSISFWPLTLKQIQRLINEYRYKSFVFVGYKSQYNSNKPIIHHCDIKVRIEDFMAYPSSRYGGNQVLDIWPERNAKKHGASQPSLFDHNQNPEVNHG